jgi:uncharacterized membrane protein YfcA
MNIDISLFALGGFAFCGGLIDAAVGGGGLVQIPALIHALPGSVWQRFLVPTNWQFCSGTHFLSQGISAG